MNIYDTQIFKISRYEDLDLAKNEIIKIKKKFEILFLYMK